MIANIALANTGQVRGAVTKDTFKCALYHSTATISKATTVYTVTGEIADASYAAGGVAITNATGPALDADTAWWQPSASIVFSTLTEAVAFDACLIYNDAHAVKYALSVHTFGDQTVTAGDFTLTMPTGDGTTGLFRIA